MPVALNVDGLERKRKKWNRLAKGWYLVSEWLRDVLPDGSGHGRADDRGILPGALRQRRACSFRTAPRWARWKRRPTLERLGLERGRYFLYVSRMEPENHPLEVREAFERVRRRPMKLALIGDAPYAGEYIRQVRDTSDPRVVMPGAIYGDGIPENWGRTVSPTFTRRRSAGRIRR